MEIEIKIGKEEVGANAITIPATCKRASRHHAKLTWRDGVVTIEDTESANGTYVNGKRIAKTKVTEDDIVWLGNDHSELCYQVDMKKVFEAFRKAESANRTDYSAEFEDLKQVYMDYQKEVSELKKTVSKKTQLPRIIPTVIMGLLTVVLLIWAPMQYKMMAGAVGSIITTLIGFFTIGKNTSINEKMTEQITDLQIKYQSRYCCPKCGMRYPFTMHWKKLEADGKCPNPKCNATFVKPN